MRGARALLVLTLVATPCLVGAATAAAQTSECEGDQIRYEVYQGHPHHAGDVVHTISDDDHPTGPIDPATRVCIWPADAPQDDSHAGSFSGSADTPTVTTTANSLSSSSDGDYYDDDDGDDSSHSSDDPPARGGLVMDIVNGLLFLALAFSPTLPGRWRLGLAAGGGLLLLLGIVDATATSDSNHTLTAWDLALPIVVGAVVLWGHWANTATGATSAGPGRSSTPLGGPMPPGGGPRPGGVESVPATVHPTPLTAGARSRVRLVATTAAPPAAVLDAVARASTVRGNFFLVWGDTVEVRRAGDGFAATAGGSATFSIRVRHGPRGTQLCVGGFDRYRVSRQYVAGFIPVTPATVLGFRAYKVFLDAVARELHQLDPGVRTRIGTPDQTPTDPAPSPA